MTAYGDGPGVAPPPAPRAAIDFDLIRQAWELMRQHWGVWALAVFLVNLIPGMIGGSLAGIQGAVVGDPNHPNPGGMALSGLLDLISTLVGGAAAAFFTVGIYRMAFKHIRGEPFSVNDAFSGGDLFLPMWGATLLIGFGTTAGLFFCLLPGLLLYSLWTFTGPLIVDKQMGVIDAMTLSFNTLKPHVWPVLGYTIVAGLIGALGALACGVGVFFTAPIYYLSLALLYRSFFPDERAVGPRLEMPLPPGYGR
jgi:uncharacterized membrane protein